MSTKVTIKSRRTEGHPGYHVYHDVLDEFGARDEGVTPFYLRVDGVAVELQTLAERNASVTITLPQEMAKELGLLASAGSARDSR